MTTALDIVNMALFDSGVVGTGQVANAQDSNNAFTRLNWMLAQWTRQRWLIWHLVDLSVTSTGAQSYTIGPAGDIAVAVRPDRLEAAFFRQVVPSIPNQIDYPLELLQSREDYNNIALKKLTTFPEVIFYDSAYPLGVLYPWPVMQSTLYELHISVKETLSQFASLSQVLSLPNEYYEAMRTNLAKRLRQAYGLPQDPGLDGMAKESLNVVRGANTQIGRLTMPLDVVRPGIYNVYSDQIR